MNNEIVKEQNTANSYFGIDAHLLPERFSVEGVLRIRDNDYIVIGKEKGRENGADWCSWLYNPNCGFIHGHYGLTKYMALRDFLERG